MTHFRLAVSLALSLSCLLGSGAARAEPGPALGPTELAELRLRYGVSLRSGAQQDLGPGLTYSGLTPNDVGLAVGYFGTGHFGAGLSVQREGFALLGSEGVVTSGALLRGHVGPSARLSAGPLRLEALVGYGFAQLPSFGSSVQPVLAAGQRHAVMFAAKAGLDLGLAVIEARGEYPLPLAASDGAGNPAQSSGFAAGASVLIPLGNVNTLAYGALLDYQYVNDSLRSTGAVCSGAEASGLCSTQQLSRLGVALSLKWLDAPPPPPPPRFGTVRVVVVDEATGGALQGASVSLTQEGKAQPVTVAADGAFTVEALRPGEAAARATAPGYLPGDGVARVVAGEQGDLKIALRREPPKVGSVAVRVTDKESGAPLEGATVSYAGHHSVSDAEGKVRFEKLPPGLLQLSVTLKGYKPGKGVASVVASQESPMPIALLHEARRALSTISGLVRSTRGGQPISADLELPEAHIKTRANAAGAFTFKVEGGTYSVIISAPGFIRQARSVRVKDGDQAIFNVDMHPQ